jgi:hypothetical protein
MHLAAETPSGEEKWDGIERAMVYLRLAAGGLSNRFTARFAGCRENFRRDPQAVM